MTEREALLGQLRRAEAQLSQIEELRVVVAAINAEIEALMRELDDEAADEDEPCPSP
jgi:hypothetical protein